MTKETQNLTLAERLIDEWHDLSESDPRRHMTLSAFLNLTEDEYTQVFRSPNELDELVRERNPEALKAMVESDNLDTDKPPVTRTASGQNVPHARLFHLVRSADVSGVSGTGVVALGTQYPNGKCTISWLGELSCIGVYDSLEQLLGIHGHGGRTNVEFLDA